MNVCVFVRVRRRLMAGCHALTGLSGDAAVPCRELSLSKNMDMGSCGVF